METIAQSYRGLHLLMDLNWDRFFYLGTLAAALGCGAIMGSVIH